MNAVIETTTQVVTVGALALNAWHHVGWPIVMKAVTRMLPASQIKTPSANGPVPHITLVIPAYNEAEHVAAKLRNLATLDYPSDSLSILLACDGCTDDTVAIARATLAEPDCVRLNASVLDYKINRGKVAVLNQTIFEVRNGIVALTDVSAMLPRNALRRAAAHFDDPQLGAVGGTYRLSREGSRGEAGYWGYQVAIKRGEAALGAPLGLHGAFYAFRREAWAPLPADTINDDFILPLEIFRRGWRVAYDENIVVLEAEVSDNDLDKRRRRRIAAGNAQQIGRLAWLLNPRYRGVALAFGSGKVLRVLAPFLFAASLVGSITLAAGSPPFAMLAAMQLAGLAGALIGAIGGAAAPRVLALFRYAVSGHIASATGVMRYCTQRTSGPWARATGGQTAAGTPKQVHQTADLSDLFAGARSA